MYVGYKYRKRPYKLFYTIPFYVLKYVKETGKTVKINISTNLAREICITSDVDTIYSYKFVPLEIYSKHNNIVIKIGDREIYYNFSEQYCISYDDEVIYHV